MSTQNDGLNRTLPLPLDSRGVCYISGRRTLDNGLNINPNPVAVIGSADAFTALPTAASSIYAEISGAGIDFHNGTATVAGLGYDVRMFIGGASAVAGESYLGLGSFLEERGLMLRVAWTS